MVRVEPCVFHGVGLCHKADCQGAKATDATVEWESVQRIINAEFQGQYAHADINKCRQKAENDGHVWGGHGARARDNDQAGQGSVEHGDQIKDMVLDLDDEQRGHTSHGWGQGAGHGATRNRKDGGGIRWGVHDCQCGTWVEPVPSEPEDKSAEGGQTCRVSWHRDHITVRVESARAGTDYYCTEKPCPTTNGVNADIASKINQPMGKGIWVEDADPPGGAPYPMGRDWIDKGGQEERVCHISVKRRSFCDGAGHNGGARRGKSILEEPEVIQAGIRASQAKVGVTNEAIR
mmetsp:Transcript_5567/g.9911  ORF Transcript_5567/g.9911 Transcript_5567/m.9911 type:complete len:291 (-) Transcript_5567:181-1053(-)